MKSFEKVIVYFKESNFKLLSFRLRMEINISHSKISHCDLRKTITLKENFYIIDYNVPSHLKS